MKKKPRPRLFSRKTIRPEIPDGAPPEVIIEKLSEFQAQVGSARAHVERVLRGAETYEAAPELADIHAEVRRAAASLRRALVGSTDPYVIASAALELGDLVSEMNIETTLAKPAMAGFKTMEGGRKGGRETAKDPHGRKHHALVNRAKALLKGGIAPRNLASECVAQNVSSLTAKQTRTVLQNAGLVPRRKGK